MTRVALYARVASGPQERSLDAQLHELRGRAAQEGFEVIEEVRDLAEKRHMIDRPGLDRLRELAASGAIEEVWAVEYERFGEGDVPMLLGIELGAHDVRCRWPGDGGEGLGGELLRAVAGVLSREEQRKRAERSRRGKRDKTRRGLVLGAAPGPRYGFCYARDERGRPVGYEVDGTTMAVVRRIFEMLASGESIHAVQTVLEADGVPAPRGGPLWSRDTFRKMVLEDTYLPHSPGELDAFVAEGLLSEEIRNALHPDRPYGVAYYGRTRSFYASPHSKKRTVEMAPRSEWTAVPVDLSGSGLERGKIERARRVIEGNRVPSKVADYEYELSRGFLFCADCGLAMLSHARRSPTRAHHYYRCDGPRKTRGTAPPCPNRRSHRAIALEYDAVRLFERNMNWETLLELYNRAVEEQKGSGDPGERQQRRAALAGRVNDLKQERNGYLRQNARSILSDDELDAMLAEVDGQLEAVHAELRAAEDEAAAERRIEAARDSLAHASRYNPVHAEWYEDPDATQPGEVLTLASSTETIRRTYRRYGARFEVDSGGGLTLRLDLALGSEALGLTTSSP